MFSRSYISDEIQSRSVVVPFELTENDQFVVGVVFRVTEQFGHWPGVVVGYMIDNSMGLNGQRIFRIISVLTVP